MIPVIKDSGTILCVLFTCLYKVGSILSEGSIWIILHTQHNKILSLSFLNKEWGNKYSIFRDTTGNRFCSIMINSCILFATKTCTVCNTLIYIFVRCRLQFHNTAKFFHGSCPVVYHLSGDWAECYILKYHHFLSCSQIHNVYMSIIVSQDKDAHNNMIQAQFLHNTTEPVYQTVSVIK